MREGVRWAACVLLSWSLAALAAAPAGAQEDVEELARACGGTSALLGHCRESALAVQAGQGAVGLAAAGGSQLPSTASTLGRRFGGTPRFSWSLRGTLAHSDLPDVGGSGAAPWEGEGSPAFGVQGSLALGVFDGFSLLPTVGGLFSLDVLGAAGLLLLPDDQGFQDDPRFFGLGVRVGILRESFTTPGVTVEATRRWVGDLALGDFSAGDRMEADLDPTVTSVRALAGKDLLSLGILAGVGWDRYSSEGELRAEELEENEFCAQSCPVTPFEGFQSDRLLFFGGAALNLLLLQLSAEGGWAQGFDAPAGRPEGGYDPGDSSLFLSLTARLTL